MTGDSAPGRRRPGVFLDRDGVLNAAVVREGRPYPPRSAGEMRILPGAIAACAELRAAGLPLIVVTNQPDIGRGTADQDDVARINARLVTLLKVDEVVTCPHDDADGCACRKPLPGMITAAAERWAIDLSASVTVGDRWRDIDAGRAAGTRTVFIDRGYRERRPTDPDLTVRDLEEAVAWIIQATTSSQGAWSVTRESTPSG